MDIKWFPFDEQTCKVIINTENYPSEDVSYTTDRLTHNNLEENKIWSLVKLNYTIESFFYEGYGSYSFIHLNVVIRRKPLFVVTNLMVPALFLSIVTLISFHIPFAQAMPIGISILLAYSVLTIRCAFYINFATKLKSRFLFNFILRLNDSLPSQSDVVPLLSIYFIMCMIFSITGMIWFASLNKIKEKKWMPKILKYFVAYCLAFVFCMPKTRKELKNAINGNQVIDLKDEKIKDFMSPDHVFLVLISIFNRFIFTIFFIFATIHKCYLFQNY